MLTCRPEQCVESTHGRCFFIIVASGDWDLRHTPSVAGREQGMRSSPRAHTSSGAREHGASPAGLICGPGRCVESTHSRCLLAVVDSGECDLGHATSVAHAVRKEANTSKALGAASRVKRRPPLATTAEIGAASVCVVWCVPVCRLDTSAPYPNSPSLQLSSTRSPVRNEDASATVRESRPHGRRVGVPTSACLPKDHVPPPTGGGDFNV